MKKKWNEKEEKEIWKNLKSRCHTKRKMGAATSARPSFGMTMTQENRDLFVWHSPHVFYCLPGLQHDDMIWHWSILLVTCFTLMLHNQH